LPFFFLFFDCFFFPLRSLIYIPFSIREREHPHHYDDVDPYSRRRRKQPKQQNSFPLVFGLDYYYYCCCCCLWRSEYCGYELLYVFVTKQQL
jgi:hypothetical protein